MAKLVTLTVDFETFWDKDHTLSKMSPIAYVLSPKTELISLAYKFGDGPTEVIFGEREIKAWSKTVDWANTMVIGHNMSGFDSMILAWRLGAEPKMWACTAAMARPWFSKTQAKVLNTRTGVKEPKDGVSLAKLVAEFKLGVKDQNVLHDTKGRNLKDFTAEEVEAMRKYNAADVDQCWGLFKHLFKVTTPQELLLVDMTTRMLVCPQFIVDRDLLTTTLAEERERKHNMLLDLAKSLGMHRKEFDTVGEMLDHDKRKHFDEIAAAVGKTLGSATKFSALLTSLGVEVPTKISPTTGKKAPALAKTDEAFVALQEHENPVVAAAAQARLGVKSTLLETRIEAFITASDPLNGLLPAPLRYAGADTTGRWSGEQYNPQNLPRVSGKPSDALRNCLTAGAGKKVVVADLSGIELRVNHFLWKVPSSMALYQADPEKADLYKDFAAALYDIDKSEVSKAQRQVGKVAHLGLGFGAGAATFQKVAKLMGGVTLSEAESADVVAKWRGMYKEIVRGWKTCHSMLPYIEAGEREDIDPWGLCRTTKNGIILSSGRQIRYPDLRQEDTEEGNKEWVYGHGRNKARIYAGKIDENCLAEGTLVLTDHGWKPIETVSLSDMVHDGDSFVFHSGLLCKSVQQCVSIDGVYMTADHEVLDESGNWKAASQLPRPYRPAIRSADRLASVAQRRKEVVLDVQVPVREPDNEVGAGHYQGCEARRDTELRVFDEATHLGGEPQSRYDQAPGVWGLSQHDGPLSSSVASGLEKLRRAWDYGVRSVAGVVRELLGGHGAVVPAWTGAGQTGQQPRVLTGELPLGFAAHQHTEQTKLSGCGYPPACAGNGHFEVDAVLPTEARLVFDILDAGAQHRFVVLGENGPFIVHNCVQAIARDVIAGNAVKVFQDTGLRPALMVHDELVYVVPEEIAEETLAHVQKVMRTPPDWWPELVTWSEGDIASTYGEAK